VKASGSLDNTLHLSYQSH